jgi:N-acetylmuramic acid 6-phosphate etherase
MMDSNDPTKHLTTEGRNPLSLSIDQLNSLQIAQLMNAEDKNVALAVERELGAIAKAIEWIAEAFRKSGRLFYIGAGTSGRLGVLDASECPPTFSTPPSMVVGVIAGGSKALTTAVEGAEDDSQQAALDLQAHQFGPNDVLVGIATSGRTPYVIGALQYAASLNARRIGFSCNADSELQHHAELMIAPVVGPEIISGSTRLKAGTATKMVLNMLTTGAMVLIGKTYGNLMVDLRASNSKLILRSQRIVSEITGLTAQQAVEVIDRCDGEVKTAIVVSLCQVEPQKARSLLVESGGKLREALIAGRHDG